jgi:dolichyl-phosphate-mannose-protein mannosyltransferase
VHWRGNALLPDRTRFGSDRFWGWAAPALIAVFGGFLRFWRLGTPHKLIFDETYYVKEGDSFLHYGVELGLKASLSSDPNKRNEAADKLFNAGNLNIHGTDPEFVVHPPLGKWMIAAGEWLFGSTSSWGWRFAAATVGTLAILMVGRIGRRLFGSTLLGSVAALLLAVDGEELVHSRVSILDIFVMFWALAAFGCLLVDRDKNRARLLARAAAAPGGTFGALAPAGGWLRGRASGAVSGATSGPASGSTSGPDAGSPEVLSGGGEHRVVRVLRALGPWSGMRWWRIAGVVCLGLCTGVKWSGLYFAAVFLLMSFFWDCSARRAAGARHWFLGAVLRDGVQALFTTAILMPAVYVSTWVGWFHSSLGWDRHWAETNHADSGWGWVPNSLRSLLHYHSEMWNSAIGITSKHDWQANPWAWLVLGRPTLFFNDISQKGQAGCTAASCSQMITDLGNPLIWWPGTLAVGVLLFYWVLGRDWRAGAALAGLIGGYLPWFQYQERTIFEFYAVAFAPWVVLGVTYCLGLVLGPPGATAERRRHGAIAVGGYLVLTVLVMAFFYPILAGEVISSADIGLRRWLTSWF